MRLRRFLLHNLFFQYRRFFSYDIEFSLVCGRNFLYLDILRFILLKIVDDKNKDLSEQEHKRLLQEIKKLCDSIIFSDCIKKYEGLKIRIYEGSTDVTDHDFDELNRIFNEILKKNLLLYLVTYEIVFRKISAKHEGMLVELNNALSHILSYVMDKDRDIVNINKANDHLIRGTLDGLKAIIVLKKDKIVKNEELFKKLINIRIDEGKNIGKISSSNIVKNYINFLKELSD